MYYRCSDSIGLIKVYRAFYANLCEQFSELGKESLRSCEKPIPLDHLITTTTFTDDYLGLLALLPAICLFV